MTKFLWGNHEEYNSENVTFVPETTVFFQTNFRLCVGIKISKLEPKPKNLWKHKDFLKRCMYLCMQPRMAGLEPNTEIVLSRALRSRISFWLAGRAIPSQHLLRDLGTGERYVESLPLYLCLLLEVMFYFSCVLILLLLCLVPFPRIVCCFLSSYI